MLHVDQRSLKVSSLDNGKFYYEGYYAVEIVGPFSIGGRWLIESEVERSPEIGELIGADKALHQFGRFGFWSAEFQKQVRRHDGGVVVIGALLP